MKRLITTILVIVMLVGIAIGVLAEWDEEIPEEYPMHIFCHPKDVVNVRFSPSKKSQIVGTYECGDIIYTDGVVKKDNRGGKWLHIWCSFEVGEAWISKRYVSESDVTIGSCLATVVMKGNTALRRAPGGNRIRWLHYGDELMVLCFTDDWVLTTQGYVKTECVEITW